MENGRKSGILMHPTSLPGDFGIGSLGKEAYKFVDFLIKSKQQIWQILPLGPTGYGDSPYQCFSSKAGNPLLIDLELLVEDGWLQTKELNTKTSFDNATVDFNKVSQFKHQLFKIAFDRFSKNTGKNGKMDINKVKFDNFCEKNANWLDNYALFMALKGHHGGIAWLEWETTLMMRNKNALAEYQTNHQKEIDYHRFVQYLFFKQWIELKSYANQHDIEVLGDIPIYCPMDSVEAWTSPEIFQFAENRRPIQVAGVPPDYFSTTGQLWGNPLYNWDKLKETGFKLWIDRIKSNLTIYNSIRIDHFRGFAAYWAIPFGEETAINGEWVKAPGMELFEAIRENLGDLPIIAEDLGVITEDVVQLRKKFGLSGMKILQFAFDPNETNNYLPYTFAPNYVVYTGTHDNDTVMGWYKQLTEKGKDNLHNYTYSDGSDISWSMIRLAWESVANVAIVPVQDLLALGSEARMNTPGTSENNWIWRCENNVLTDKLAQRLKKLTELYGRDGEVNLG